jgi:hypothetical protein
MLLIHLFLLIITSCILLSIVIHSTGFPPTNLTRLCTILAQTPTTNAMNRLPESFGKNQQRGHNQRTQDNKNKRDYFNKQQAKNQVKRHRYTTYLEQNEEFNIESYFKPSFLEDPWENYLLKKRYSK